MWLRFSWYLARNEARHWLGGSISNNNFPLYYHINLKRIISFCLLLHFFNKIHDNFVFIARYFISKIGIFWHNSIGIINTEQTVIMPLVCYNRCDIISSFQFLCSYFNNCYVSCWAVFLLWSRNVLSVLRRVASMSVPTAVTTSFRLLAFKSMQTVSSGVLKLEARRWLTCLELFFLILTRVVFGYEDDNSTKLVLLLSFWRFQLKYFFLSIKTLVW